MSFVHLHNHTHFSLLDGLPKPVDYIKIAKEQKAPAVAITDHGVLYGAIEFYQKAKEYDINPIIGCEVYLARNSRHDRQAGRDNKSYHLTLLAETTQGYENLIQLVTLAHLAGFYYKPRIDKELLKKYSKGLIVLSGCVQSQISQSALSGNIDDTVELIKEYQTIFGKENFFLEVMDHPEVSVQSKVNKTFIELAHSLNVPLVATNDNHYALPEDKEAHDVLICIQTQCKVEDEDRMRYTGNFSMRSPQEMKQAFKHIPEAIENTLEIAARCKVEMKFGQNLIPAFKTPDKKSSKEYLEELCKKGLSKRYGENPSLEAKERLKYELEVIHEMGFDTYFLIVQDIVNFAKKEKIIVGPGRGSAAGSIIAYVLGITDIDPLKYHLYFERFLNPERISMPDIDIDFADDRRDEILEYIVNTYGKDKVAQIITFGTMAARAAVRDVGRVLNISYSEVDAIAKLISPRPGTKLQDALEEDPDLKDVYNASPINKKLIDTAMKLEGVIRHASVHACAVVISQEPLTKYTALQTAPGKETNIITQYSMKPLEDIGLLKMDFLGLKNLTIIERTLKIIQRTKEKEVDLKEIPMDDAKTFELMAQGKTTGVFQFESPGMKRYLKQLKPSRFADLIAMNALYRPGPMDWIPSYIKGKHNQDKITYLNDSFKPILEETYGVAVYQEQILEIARQFAGFTLGEADILRKAVGKKIISLLTEQRENFIQGAIKKGYSKQFAIEVFEKVIEPFAGYGFNKAHSTCYAMIAYQTAYLKTRYPAEFMTALLTSDQEDTDRVVINIKECDEMGITVLPPDINESLADFTTIDDKTIRFGLSAIKGLGLGTVEEILKARTNTGRFHSIGDFAKRVNIKVLNKKTIEALARSGAMDNLGERNAIASNVETIVKYAREIKNNHTEGQTDIFSMMEHERSKNEIELQKVDKASRSQRLTWEKEYLGLYVTGHPLDGLKKYFKKKVNLIDSLSKKHVGKRVLLGGLIVQSKLIHTKQGAKMLYLTIEDPSGKIEVTVFPKTYHQYREHFEMSNIVIMTGKIQERRGELKFLCEEAKSVDLEKMIEKAREDNLYDESERIITTLAKNDEENFNGEEQSYTIKIPAGTDIEILEKIKKLLERHRGEDRVEIHIMGKKNSQKIQVPFGIKINRELKIAVKELIRNL